MGHLHRYPAAGDFDGDGRNDFADLSRHHGTMVRPGFGGLALHQADLGLAGLGDVPAPPTTMATAGTDIAVFRTATASGSFSRSSGGRHRVAWGAPAFGDTPVPADYDGDGKADLAVYRRSTGQWLILPERRRQLRRDWGVPAAGDVPVPAEIQQRRQDRHRRLSQHDGQWFVVQSTGSSTTDTWGLPAYGDAPVPADYDGDGSADVAIAPADRRLADPSLERRRLRDPVGLRRRQGPGRLRQ